MFPYYSIVFYVGSIQGVILAIFLFTVKSNKIANRLLGFLAIGWAILIFAFAIQEEGFYREYPHFLKTVSHLLLLYFPLLFLNVKYLISKHSRFDLRDMIHFIPFLISVLLYTDFYFLSGENKILVVRSDSGFYHTVKIIFDLVVAVQGIAYSVISLIMLNRYNNEVLNHISNIDRKLIRNSFFGIIILLLSWIIGTVGVVLDIFRIEISIDLFYLVYLLIVLCIYWISFNAIKSPEIFKLDRNELYPVQNDHSDKLGKQFEKLNETLERYLSESKPYLDPELKLQDMADQLNMSRHQLSQLINRKHKKNFYEFINQHRVQEVIKLMRDPQNKDLKIIALAYDAGFNSKASFNRVFRQLTGKTPSEYMSTV